MSRVSRKTLVFNLGIRNFKLTHTDYSAGKKLPVYEVILGVITCQHNPRMIEGLPIAIYNDPPDYHLLVKGAVRRGLQNQVLYVLEGTLHVLKKFRPKQETSELETAIEELRGKMLPEDQLLSHIDRPNEWEILSRDRWPEGIRCHVIGEPPFYQFEDQFMVYEGTGIVYPDYKSWRAAYKKILESRKQEERRRLRWPSIDTKVFNQD